jgi:hypothetical protein
MQSKEHIGDNEVEDKDEDDRLDNSPVAEAILKRPGSFSRSRSRTGTASEGASHKDSIEERDQSPQKESNSIEQSPGSKELSISDSLSKTDASPEDEKEKPFLEELVFPSLLGR